MKNYLKNYICLFLLFSVSLIHGQTPEQISEITKDYNQSLLHDQAQKLLRKSRAEKQEAIRYAQANNLPVSYTTEDGGFAEIQRILPDGTSIYYRTYNKDAARSTRANHLNTGGSTGFNLNGQNMTAHVWDGGHPRTSHQEYGGRVSTADNEGSGINNNGRDHAAHVIGTIAAAGIQPQAKGMAPQANVRAYEWNNDLSEATAAAGQGMLISNHSYGYRASDLPNWYFGAYVDESRAWDNLMFTADNYLMVVAAGNDGQSTGYNGAPLASGYDMLSAQATAKNNLVVANGKDANVNNNGDLVSFPGLDPTSSPGPTDDLRIKPDITGNGYYVYSSTRTSNSSYDTYSGTSMASPNVAGSLLLLQEHHYKLKGSYMRAATLKGLALHTADDIGPAGPDAKHGWGLLNVKKAAETISNNEISSIVQERTINQGQTITVQVEADGIGDLQASISWTDRPGTAKTGGQPNQGQKALVNDLDIRIAKGSNTYFPWRLTSATQNSKNGDNSVDPYERIDIANATGTYTITITHKGNLQGGSQKFSLIVTGITQSCQTVQVPQNITTDEITHSNARISWMGTEPGFDLRYRKTGETSWTTVSNITDTIYILTGLDSDTNYEVQIRSKCGGNNSNWSAIKTFKTLVIPPDVDCDQGPDSNAAYGGYYADNTREVADDFMVTSGQTLNIGTIELDIFLPKPHSSLPTFNVKIYGNATGNKPGNLVQETLNITPNSSDILEQLQNHTHYRIYLPVNYSLTGGQGGSRYWLSVRTNTSQESLWEYVTEDIQGERVHVYSQGNWVPAENNYDVVFKLRCPEVICTEPGDLTALEISSTTADIEWTAGGDETSWNISWGPEGYAPGDTNETGNATSNTESYQITGLDADTNYEIYVQADCGDGVSNWTGPLSIRTDCEVKTVPYLIDFDNELDCVYIENAGNGNNWALYQNSFAGFDGFWAGYQYHETNPANAWLYTAPVALEAGIHYKISYKYGSRSSSYTEKMRVAIGTDSNSAAMTTILEDHPSITASPLYNTIIFTVPTTGVYYFGFNAYSAPNQWLLLLDDIHVELAEKDYIYENGNWTPEHPNISAGDIDNIIVINGTTEGNDAIHSELDIKNITVNEGATLINNSILNLHGDMIIDGELIFGSGPDFDGELGYVSASSTITGNATVHRYMSENRSYRMVSSPVTTGTGTIRDNWQEGVNNPDTNTNFNPNEGFGTHITGSTTGANGFDATQTGNPSLFTVDIAGQRFVAIPNTNATGLNAGDAFLLMVRGDRSIDLNDPDNQAHNETILRTTGELFVGSKTENYSVSSGDFVMFGNPYQSVLDAKAVLEASTNVNTGKYYIYDPTLGTHGSYVTVEFIPGGVNSDPTSEANQYLQPGQAAQIIAADTGNLTLNFNESQKAPGEFTATHRGTVIDNMLTVQLFTVDNFNQGRKSHDSFRLLFDSNFSNEINQDDAIMPFNFYENIGINNNGTYLSIERRDMPQENEVFQIYSIGYSVTDYMFKITQTGLNEAALYLYDKFNGEMTLLEEGENHYTFQVDKNDPLTIAEDRFEIRAGRPLGIEDNDLLNLNLYPNPIKDDTFHITAPELSGASVQITIADVVGKIVHTEIADVVSGRITVSTKTNLSSGVYMVSMKHKEHTYNFKLIKE